MKICIVGAGFGGLAAAAMLGKNGHNVTVFEKNEGPGGRAGIYTEKGYTFDMGPSWYLMPDVYETFFAALGTAPEEHFNLVLLDPAYRIFFEDRRIVDISSDPEKTIALFDTFEEGGGSRLRDYLQSAAEMYEVSKDLIYRDYRTIFDVFDRKLVLEGTKMHALESLDSFVGRYFYSDEAKKVVEYSIGFLGGSPKNTPAFYHIMSHIDLTLGVWYPQGGIRQVVDAIHDIAWKSGVIFRYDEPVEEILVEGDTAIGVRTTKATFGADLVIVNADYAHAELDLLPHEGRTYPRHYWEKRVMAPSAFVAYLGVSGEIPELAHHNLFLERDRAEGLDHIFDTGRPAWPEHPSYYVNVPSKTDTTAAPEGCETLFVMVPLAPGLEDSPERREAFLERILDDLEAKIGRPIREQVEVKRIFALSDFTRRYNAYRGTALGLTQTLWQTALFRPAYRSRHVKNLYFTGQYTHPGIGVPMTLISSQIVDREIRTDMGREEELRDRQTAVPHL
ncbi:phytoene desaturase family protein [Methanofollis fontis]|uniref:Phytoene desaturase n=1 Tax=Methanofollis fontis TaxID=2052832 RepID=A0A483CNV0_9EURY|nr:phytoene desaturase family protein [Methanofollis fontis]TAJ44680.1 phytoene desaturase [Methanofollis fontis]